MTINDSLNTGTPTQPTPPRRSRWRSVLVGGALVLSGVIIGVGTTAISQDFGPRRSQGETWGDDSRPGWRGDRGQMGDMMRGRGMMGDRDHMMRERGSMMGDRYDRSDRYDRDDRSDRYGRDDRDSGRSSRFDDDRDDRRGYGPGFGMRGDGPRGWMGWRSGDGWRDGHRFGGMGGPFLSPGRIERMVNRIARVTDASSDQRQRMYQILRDAASDLQPIRERHVRARREILDILTAQNIDRGRLENIRSEHVGLIDQVSKRVVAALADAAEVLTPAQRAEVARTIERRQSWFDRR